MDEKKLRLIVAIMVTLIGVGYFVWLCLVFMRFNETDKFVRQTVSDYYQKVPKTDGGDSND